MRCEDDNLKTDVEERVRNFLAKLIVIDRSDRK